MITWIVRFMRGVSNKSVCPNQKRNRVYCNDKYTELGVTRRNMFGRGIITTMTFCIELVRLESISHKMVSEQKNINQKKKTEKMVLQGDPNQSLLLQIAIALKICIFDPKLVKPKCVWVA